MRKTMFLLCISLVLAGGAVMAQRGGKGDPFSRIDKNGDGKVSRSEFPGPSPRFNKIDSDGDGYLTRKEMRKARKNRPSGQQERKGGEKLSGKYPDLKIIKHNPEKSWNKPLYFVDTAYDKILKTDYTGKILWEYLLPEKNRSCTRGGFCSNLLSDVEILPNGNLLYLSGGLGAYEITPAGKCVWSYENPIVSHDVDRLPNGNTLMACAGAEMTSDFPYKDPQAIEVDKNGKIVWSWKAKKHYLNSKYKDIRSRDAKDWTHVNSVCRLPDGYTLISVRNWQMVIIVDKNGKTVTEIGQYIPHEERRKNRKPDMICPHTPQLLDNGNLLVSEPTMGAVIEYDTNKKRVLWSFPRRKWPHGGNYYFIRDAQLLPNGNIFFVDSMGQLLEVTREGEIVWQARVKHYKKLSKPPELGKIHESCLFKADLTGTKFYGGR